jgi:hypothetical protein
VPEAPRRGVQGVSYPRSGHSLLVQFLKTYIGPEFHYCEYYTDCREWPCVNRGNHFQKNHDFGLSLPVSRDRPLLVQFRSPLYSIASNFLLLAKQNPARFTLEGWERYAIVSITAWRQWIHKWVLGLDHKDALLLSYDKVVRHPDVQLSRALLFFGIEPDSARVRSIVERLEVRRSAFARGFPFYDADFLRWVEQHAAAEMDAIGAPTMDEIEAAEAVNRSASAPPTHQASPL